MPSIRPLLPGDAGSVDRMVVEFGAYLRALGDPWEHNFTVERYLADGFGPNPAFSGFIAEAPGGAPLGYILLSPNYDVDLGMRIWIIVDLWVGEAARRSGTGRALVRAASEAARRAGARRLVWAVYRPNHIARAFYLSIGAQPVEDLDWMYLGLD